MSQNPPKGPKKKERKRSAGVLVQSCNKSGKAGSRSRPDGSQGCDAIPRHHVTCRHAE
jgi:hypothetical protein